MPNWPVKCSGQHHFQFLVDPITYSPDSHLKKKFVRVETTAKTV